MIVGIPLPHCLGKQPGASSSARAGDCRYIVGLWLYQGIQGACSSQTLHQSCWFTVPNEPCITCKQQPMNSSTAMTTPKCYNWSWPAPSKLIQGWIGTLYEPFLFGTQLKLFQAVFWSTVDIPWYPDLKWCTCRYIKFLSTNPDCPLTN